MFSSSVFLSIKIHKFATISYESNCISYWIKLQIKYGRIRLKVQGDFPGKFWERQGIKDNEEVYLNYFLKIVIPFIIISPSFPTYPLHCSQTAHCPKHCFLLLCLLRVLELYIVTLSWIQFLLHCLRAVQSLTCCLISPSPSFPIRNNNGTYGIGFLKVSIDINHAEYPDPCHPLRQCLSNFIQ